MTKKKYISPFGIEYEYARPTGQPEELRDVRVQVMVGEDEAAAIRHAASLEKKTVSSWIRELALAAVKREVEARRVKKLEEIEREKAMTPEQRQLEAALAHPPTLYEQLLDPTKAEEANKKRDWSTWKPTAPAVPARPVRPSEPFAPLKSLKKPKVAEWDEDTGIGESGEVIDLDKPEERPKPAPAVDFSSLFDDFGEDE